MVIRVTSQFKKPVQNSLSPILHFLKISCIWYEGRSKWKSLFFYTSLIYMFIYTTNLIINIIFHPNFQLFIILVQNSAFLLGTVKISTFVNNRQLWERLVYLLNVIEIETSDTKYEHSFIVIKYKKYCHWAMYYLLMCLPLCFVLFINFWLNNVILPIIYSQNEVHIIYLFHAWLPFNQETLGGRCISGVLQNIYAIITIVSVWCWDIIVFTIMVFLSGQLKALRVRCSNALDDPSEDICMENLIGCHRHYLLIHE